MINQTQMANSFKAADSEVLSVRVKEDGTRDGNGMRSVVKKLTASLEGSGVTPDSAHKLASKWFHKNRK